MKKKLPVFLSVIFTLVLALLFIPTTIETPVFAESSGYYTYSVSFGEATITDVNTSISGDITIPSSLGGYPVTSIGSSAFYGCSKLTSITIGNSVTSIGDYAFGGCSSLTSVTIGNSVTSIGSYAFSACSKLTSIAIGNSVTSIGSSAFEGCSSLTSVTIPDSVTSIGSFAFYKCSSLNSVTIGNSVTSIGNYAFYDCRRLTSVYFSDLKAWCEIEFSSSGSNPLYYAGTLYLNGEKVTDLVIPEGTTKISNYAFYHCSSLTSVTIPGSVTSIGSSAFEGCSSLTSVYISDLKAWCEIEFAGSDSNPLCYAGTLYLNGEKGTDLVIPEGITKIGDYAFYKCSSLTSVTIPGSVTSIGFYAFFSCDNLKWVGYEGRKVEWDKIAIGSENGKLTTAKRYYNYCKGGQHNYQSDCSTLCSGCLWERITWTGHSYDEKTNLCTNCSTHKFLTLTSDPTGEVFTVSDCDTNATGALIIPDQYLGRPITTIGSSAFRVCISLTSLNIPDSVTTIGNSAFYGCRSLTSINIPDNVTSIGEDAFENCSSLTSVTIPDSVTSIGSSAFYNCNNLKSITIGNSVTAIDSYAFKGCSSLNSITIPKGVTSIDSGTFFGCSTLKEIILPKSVTTIKSNAFNGCVITDIWYTGSVEDRNLIVRESGNDALVTTWHFIDNACDSSCSACDATRTTKHVYDSSEDLICNECGYERPPYVPGDLDGVEGITLDDAIYLLYYVNFPEKYLLNQPVDFDSSGKEDLDDAIYLLYHINFPGKYPLK